MQHPTLCGALISTFVLALTPAASADVLCDWNVAALNAIRQERTPPPIASRALAILHTSMFDAINGIVRAYEPYLVPSAVPASASVEGAASAAAHRVLVTLFPEHAAEFEALHAEILSALGESPQTRRGTAWGDTVALRVLSWRSRDGADAAVDLPASTGPGAWVPTPPAFLGYALPQWGLVVPFTMANVFDFRPAGPPALDSAAYADDYNEVKALGAATGSIRSAEQSLIAVFWADGAGTETPPGHWNSIAREVSDALATPLVEKARLFALLNVAMADAAICSWDAKYVYAFWRPVTAIRQGDTDGNDATAGDPDWSSFIGTPPFPDYVSGHSTFSAAAATVLAMFYGTDDVAFTATSDGLPGVRRAFHRFSDAAAEAAVSRVYGGIHFRSASEDGIRLGAAIGAWAFAKVMQPTENRSRR